MERQVELINRKSPILATLLLISAEGCAATGGRAAPAPGGLESRAQALLLRAAKSDLGPPQANAIEALTHLAPEVGGPVFYEALESEIPLVRYAGCVALGEIRDKAALSRLRRMLEDPEPRVRLGGAFAICRCGDDRPGRLLVETLNNHADESMRSDAAYLIGLIGEKKALKRLQLAEKREKSNRVLLHLYTAMTALGDERATDLLINSAQGDTISRLLAIQGLDAARVARAAPALKYRFNDTQDYLQTRLLAARALGHLGLKDGYELAVKSLSYTDSNAVEEGRVRANAALALGAIGDRAALPLLENLAQAEANPATQVAACAAILEILNPRRR